MRDNFRKKLIIQTFSGFAVLYLLICLLRYRLFPEKPLSKFSATSSAGRSVIKLNNERQGQHEYNVRSHKVELPSLSNELANKNAYSLGNETSFDYKAAMDKLNKERVAHDDPRLIDLIRNYYIEPPSDLPYNLTYTNRTDFSRGQAPFVDSRLHYLEGGFFVECGAFTGESSSNSLFFEKTRKWSGLLVEADPLNYAVLKTKNRKAYSINACLNTKPYPEMVTFNQARNTGRLVHNKEIENWMQTHRRNRQDTQVQCFPLYSLLLALSRTRIDFFSLDVEGDELYVLQTIPYDKVDIRMMTVEFAHVKSGKESIRSYLLKQGYESLIEVVRRDWGANDIIFRKKN